MDEVWLFISGWRLLVEQMTAWGKAVFAIACLLSLVAGIFMGMQPSDRQIRTETAEYAPEGITYLTSGVIVAPYRNAFVVGDRLILDSLSEEWYRVTIPENVLWVYVGE